MLGDLKFLYHMLKFSKDPTNTIEVFRFTDALIDASSAEDRKVFSASLLQDERTAQFYRDNNPDYIRKPFDLKELIQCPKGSLGRIYAEAMLSAGLDPEFFAYNKVDDAASLVTLRLRKTHDIYHILTGFKTDVPGEIGLQGFYVGQLHLPVPLAIMVSGLLYCIKSRSIVLIQDAFEQLVHGYQSGVRAQKLHGVVWEQLWDRDLDDVRAMFGIMAPLSRPLAMAV